ncbi:hypothetical protein [Rubrivivax gelatinosus]|uniref:hypothetical protein n=1 Tax=Rubrivivax gelatinosus TaxID=28068 RepID=UPI001A92636E
MTCSGGAPWRACQALLAALAAAALAAWAHGWLADGYPSAFFSLAAALAAGAFAWRLAVPRAVDLRWDGSSWSADGAGCRAEIVIDLGRWMLLRLDAPRRWLALDAREAGGRLHLLRAALYSPAATTPPSPPAAPAPLP